MEEKIRFNSTPFPLQTIFGDRASISCVDSKVIRNLPIKPKFYSSDNPSPICRRDEDRQKPNGKKSSRRVIKDRRTEKPTRKFSENTRFYKTFTGGNVKTQNSDLIFMHTHEKYVSQELISQTQGFLHTVLHQPRLSTIDRELIIVNIEGIIANYSRRELSIRSDAVNMLKDLHLRYQVVLICGWKLARYLKLISYFSSKGVYISAAYKQVGQGSGISEEFYKKRHEWYSDYSRVYKDFGINAECSKRVINLSALLADPEELKDPHYVVEHTGALRPLFMVNKAPVITLQYPFTPVTILVPHMAHLPIRLSIITDTIKSLAHFKNFYQSVQNIKSANYQVIQSSILNKEILNLYQKRIISDVPLSVFLIFKPSACSDPILLHKEKDLQTFRCSNLLEFTLNPNS